MVLCQIVSSHLELHPELHDLLVLSDELVLRLLQLLVSIADLVLQVRNLHLKLVIDGLHLGDLLSMGVGKLREMTLELLDQLLLILQLLLYHVKLFCALLE